MAAIAAWPRRTTALANDHNVRRLVALRSEPLLVHATTSRNWTAELHLHRADVDECIACRFPDATPSAAFACSTGKLETGGKTTDAALPFLSGAAGLMLARALTMHARGELVALDRNFIRLGLGVHRPGFGEFARQFAPVRTGCSHILSPTVRATLS